MISAATAGRNGDSHKRVCCRFEHKPRINVLRSQLQHRVGAAETVPKGSPLGGLAAAPLPPPPPYPGPPVAVGGGSAGRCGAGAATAPPVAAGAAGGASAAGGNAQGAGAAAVTTLPAPVPASAPGPDLAGSMARRRPIVSSVGEWNTLDLNTIKQRCRALEQAIDTLQQPLAQAGGGGADGSGASSGGGLQLTDFTVIGKLGNGANALVYLAQCAERGRLDEHRDVMLVLKVLYRHAQQPDTADLTGESLNGDRTYSRTACPQCVRF